ncbi:hypothetical protein V1517DRAFT_342137 [Lipomyces orientalis]|uniref:Uncharacterized protein n=1 Tax=Lipomyces orientalis TaxID=1233043 RepID=A0ACC3TCU2_9ASCO
MPRYDAVEQEEHDLSAKKEELAETKRKTKKIRDQMIEGRARSDDEADDNDNTSIATEQESAPRKKALSCITK